VRLASVLVQEVVIVKGLREKHLGGKGEEVAEEKGGRWKVGVGFVSFVSGLGDR
jgi:hypothetical protein